MADEFKDNDFRNLFARLVKAGGSSSASPPSPSSSSASSSSAAAPPAVAAAAAGAIPSTACSVCKSDPKVTQVLPDYMRTALRQSNSHVRNLFSFVEGLQPSELNGRRYNRGKAADNTPLNCECQRRLMLATLWRIPSARDEPFDDDCDMINVKAEDLEVCYRAWVTGPVSSAIDATLVFCRRENRALVRVTLAQFVSVDPFFAPLRAAFQVLVRGELVTNDADATTQQGRSNISFTFPEERKSYFLQCIREFVPPPRPRAAAPARAAKRKPLPADTEAT